MNLWAELGFRDNPYETSPVPPTEEGNRLLVGREKELRRLLRELRSTDTHPTIEGDNGVGKTSLVAVASYRALRQFEDQETSQLLVPIGQTFQLNSSSSVDSFEKEVLFRIGHAIIDNERLLLGAGLTLPDRTHLETWLTTPQWRQPHLLEIPEDKTDSGGTGLLAESGFREFMRTSLTRLFPSKAVGAFVCTIDNLELLETSATARDMLELLRDTVLSFPGLRWVLCGARGIVRSAASSARLQGVLSDPIELMPLPDETVPEVIARRIEVYGILTLAHAPVEPDGFDHVYKVMNYNLRNAMKVCQDFALWLDENGESRTEPAAKRSLLEGYLAEMSDRYLAETRLPPRAWTVFDALVDMGGSCSPSDFELFGFESSQAMRPHVKNLEEANLVSSSVDESDKRRKTIGISPRGWFVQYQRSGYQIRPRL